MKKFTFILLKDDFSRNLLISTIILLSLTLFILGFFFSKLPPQVPLFYSLPWGEEQLAPPYYFFLLPGITILTILGAFVFSFLFPEEKFLTRALILSITLMTFLSFYNILRILLLIF